MSNERNILRSLLLREELERLDVLEKKILSDEQFTQEVSKVLATAIKRSQAKDKSLELALKKPINNGISKAFKYNKQSIVDSLLPMMGQLIRKTVTNSIKQFVSDINRTLELNFSIKSIRWRMQAKKAGISYAEMVFQKTISYKVQELFVINRDNGLLIHHVGENETLVDNNAISGMLTVIQDFISDSVKTSEKGLFSASIGDVSYLIAAGSKAYLATVVKGSYTERLKQRSQELIDNIHADFSELIIDDSKYQNDEEFDEYLRNHLISKSISATKKPKKINWLVLLVFATLFIAVILYWSYQRSQQLQEVKNLALSTPGFVLQNIKRDNGGFIVSGLLDPIADTSALQASKIQLLSQPFVSLDKEIIQKRVSLITRDYENIRVIINKNNASISGVVSSEKSHDLLQKLHSTIGIDIVSNQLKLDYSSAIEKFILNHSNFIQFIEYKVEDNVLILEGEILQDLYNDFLQTFQANFPSISINNDKIILLSLHNKIIKEINNTIINAPKLTTENSLEQTKLLKLIQKIKRLIVEKPSTMISIIGESDCSGNKSNYYSKIRADNIEYTFIENNIPQDNLSKNIKNCDVFNSPTDKYKQNISFKVL